MRKLRVLFSAFLIIMLCLGLAPAAFAAEEPVDTSVKVYDYAGLYSQTEEASLRAMANQIAASYQTDIIVLTTNNSKGEKPMAVADDFYDQNGFGVGAGKDGLLLLLDMDNREIWISTCGGAIRTFTDKRIDHMLDIITPEMKNSAYMEAATAFFSQSEDYLQAVQTGTVPKSEQKNMLQIGGISLLIALAAAGITIAVLVGTHSNIKNTPAQTEAYLDHHSFDITNRQDVFIRTFTARTPIPKNTEGGSSTHSSGGGVSHGGGGRGF